MEGAKGSVLLNLNKFVMTTTDPQVIELKRKYGIDRLVYFVNFDADNRTEVFTPEKYAWDHGVFERSDLFSVNINTGRLEKHGHPGKLPAIDLDKYYTNIENINRAWGKQVGMQDLDFLGIKGKVHFPNALLIGNVVIESAAADVIDLNNFKQSFKTTDNGRLVLENVYITITAAGELSVAAISDAKQAIAKFEGRENEQVPATVIQQEISVETGEIKAAQKLLSSALDNPLGGIDFNPAMIKMEINKQNGGVTVEFDPKLLEEIRSQGIEGFVPVILNIQRVQSVVPLLSQNIDKAFSSLASI
jgi:hypothetical protein